LLKAELEEERRRSRRRKSTAGKRRKGRRGERRGVCWCRRKVSVVVLMVGRPVMVVVVAKGHSGERKKREDCAEKNRGRDWFFFIFGPEFPLPQAIKSTYIYRQWKRTIFSTLEKNCSP
jgi:hypothetical protein